MPGTTQGRVTDRECTGSSRHAIPFTIARGILDDSLLRLHLARRPLQCPLSRVPESDLVGGESGDRVDGHVWRGLRTFGALVVDLPIEINRCCRTAPGELGKCGFGLLHPRARAWFSPGLQGGMGYSVAAIAANAAAGLALLPTGALLFRERPSIVNLVCVFVCIVGLIMVSVRR